jgi:hypothetical protein
MGSVMVMGISTISTFIRMRAPGWSLNASGPVAAGASTPAGAPVAGVEVDGGGTCGLSSGLSCAGARASSKTAANAQIDRRLPSRCR